MEKKQMTYSELVNHVEANKDMLKTKWDVTCWLIGYNGVVTTGDWDNIRRLYLDGFVD